LRVGSKGLEFPKALTKKKVRVPRSAREMHEEIQRRAGRTQLGLSCERTRREKGVLFADGASQTILSKRRTWQGKNQAKTVKPLNSMSPPT